jgi:hypothetical protein
MKQIPTPHVSMRNGVLCFMIGNTMNYRELLVYGIMLIAAALLILVLFFDGIISYILECAM